MSQPIATPPRILYQHQLRAGGYLLPTSHKRIYLAQVETIDLENVE